VAELLQAGVVVGPTHPTNGSLAAPTFRV